MSVRTKHLIGVILAVGAIVTLSAQPALRRYPSIAARAETYAFARHTLVGIELLPSDVPNPPMPDVALEDLSVAEAFDVLVAGDPRYEWSEDDGVYNLRPRPEIMPGSLLDTRVPQFALSETGVWDVLFAVHRVFDPAFKGHVPASRVNPSITEERQRRREAELARPISMTLSDVTVRHVLNEVVRTHGDIYWRVQYVGSPASSSNLLINLNGFDGWQAVAGAR